MSTGFEWTMAARYLRARRQEGFVSLLAWFSLLGIAIGVGTLIVVMSVMNGFHEEIVNRIVGFQGHMTVVANGQGPLRDYDRIAERIRNVDGVESVTPLVEVQVMTAAGGQGFGGIVRGIKREDVKANSFLADNIVAGSVENFEGTNAIMIGRGMAGRLGVGVGDSINIISPRGNITAFGTVPRVKAFEVVAIYFIDQRDFDGFYVLMPLPMAQRYFRLNEAVSKIEVNIDHPDNAGWRAGDVQLAIGPGARVLTWKERNPEFFDALLTERVVMRVILGLIILVAGFNIISGLTMMVKDKGRDIAILRTMGATRGMIMRIFMMTGSTVGVVGTILGFILGMLFVENIESIRRWIEQMIDANLFPRDVYLLTKLPAVADPMEIFLIVIASILMSIAATIYPAYRAARLDPVEALRYE